MDVIADLAYPLPVIVICEMLGVPPEDQATFKVWSAELARSLEPTITLPPESMRRRVHASKESRDYFRGLVADRRKHLGSDILSALIAAEEEGDKLSEEELLSTCTLLLVAGHETTVNLIGNAMLQLVRHADQLEMLRAQPSLVSGAVEEVLRYDPPVQFDRRLALEDIEIGGVRVAEGQFVILLLGAANRDPAHFPDPDRFDITRNDDRHLSFGQGIHYCLGAPLARMEGAVALVTLTRRFRDFEITADSLKYKEQIIIRGLESLPIRFKVA
jgi:cytochrome P450